MSPVPRSHLPEPALVDLLEIAVACPPGAFAEFGVYQGGTAWHLMEIARRQARRLYLFDTFSGMPFSGRYDRHQVGEFGDTSLALVREILPEAIIVPGVFPESAEGVGMERLAFVHVDADQYASIAAATRVFPPLMVPGGVIVFDDYGLLPGATYAIDDWGEPIEFTRTSRALWRKPA